MMENGEAKYLRQSAKLCLTLWQSIFSSLQLFRGPIIGNYHGFGQLMKYQGQQRWPNKWFSSLYAKTWFSIVCIDSFTASHSTNCFISSIINSFRMCRLQQNIHIHWSTSLSAIWLGCQDQFFWEAKYMFGLLIFGAF